MVKVGGMSPLSVCSCVRHLQACSYLHICFGGSTRTPPLITKVGDISSLLFVDAATVVKGRV